MVSVKRPRGTRDFLPEEMAKRKWAVSRLMSIAELYGYREVMTPTFEHAELFTARSGEAIVEEMYTFKDRGGRTLVLRPEMTAPVARMFVEGMARTYPRPVKVYYFTNVFRYERPQKGRYREFWQFGVECIGANSVMADAETIMLANHMLGENGLGLKGIVLRVGHIGLIRKIIQAHVPEEHIPSLLRAIDKGNVAEMENILEAHAPALLSIVPALTGNLDLGEIDSIGDKFSALEVDIEREWAELKELITYLGDIDNVRLSLGVVRGLDYYTGIVFEIEAKNLGAESQICGGGRYDLAPAVGLNEDLPATGFAIGFDRAVIALGDAASGEFSEAKGAYIIPLSKEYSKVASDLARTLRSKGIVCECDIMGRRPSKAVKAAVARGRRFAVFIGEDEVSAGSYSVKDLLTGEQRSLSMDEMIEIMGGVQ